MRIGGILIALILSVNAWGAFTVHTQLQPDPPDVGPHTVKLQILDSQQQPVSGGDIDLIFSMPAMGTMPRMEVRALVEDEGQGVYLAHFDLSMHGTWDATLTVRKENTRQIFRYTLTSGLAGLNAKDQDISVSSASQSSVPTLNLGPERRQRIGVRVSECSRRTLLKNIRAVGLVESDSTKRSEVVLRVGGYVSQVLGKRVGDRVNTGTPLLQVYSPELISAQGDYLLAHNEHNDSLKSLARERLKNLGLSDRDIQRLQTTGKTQSSITISSPQEGTLLEVDVREGSSFSQGQVLFAIGDPQKNFVIASIFQKDARYLYVGQKGTLRLPEVISGTIESLYSNDKGEGTLNVRILPERPHPQLSPGLYVDLHFEVSWDDVLSVPATAILYSGLHTYLFLDRGEGMLEPKEVQVGRKNEEWVEILQGVEAGDKVVASGTFLVSSEAQLRAALPKFESSPQSESPQPPSPTGGAHQHHH